MNRSITVALAVAVLCAPSVPALAAPAAAPASAPAPAPAPIPPRSSHDEQTKADLQRAKTMKTWGGVGLATGLGLVVVSGISWGLRNTALRRADRQKFYVDEQRIIERARRRHITAIVGLGAGASLTVLGTALLITGASLAGRARRRASVSAAFAPGYASGALTLRF